ncbi:MAG: hypothetical protein FWC06_03180 [Treponema sp.]|nr:hypothetical protein [Treponema sp.]
MKKPLLIIFITVFVMLLFITCNEPVFYIISTEVPVTPALIDGSPTNFVEFKGSIYVASGSYIYRYSADLNGNDRGEWTRDNARIRPGGRIMSLAGTSSKLYAVSSPNDLRGVLKESINGTAWTERPEINLNVQAVFTANDRLFISTKTDDDFSIYHIDNSSNQIAVLESATEFRGVVWFGSAYFICTTNGIYTAADPSTAFSVISGSADKNFLGIINLGSEVAAIAGNGDLYSVSASGVEIKASFNNSRRAASGALAVWKRANVSLLLVGGNDINYSASTGYEYGYLEIELDNGFIKHGAVYNKPGLYPSMSSVNDSDRYSNTIGKTPVNHIYQPSPALNTNGTLIFASTQQSGVWSYRERDNIWQWNAEE